LTLYKRATCSSKVVASSSVYVCNACQHTEMARNASGSKKCPTCGSALSIVRSSAVEREDIERDDLDPSEM